MVFGVGLAPFVDELTVEVNEAVSGCCEDEVHGVLGTVGVELDCVCGPVSLLIELVGRWGSPSGICWGCSSSLDETPVLICRCSWWSGPLSISLIATSLNKGLGSGKVRGVVWIIRASTSSSASIAGRWGRWIVERREITSSKVNSVSCGFGVEGVLLQGGQGQQ